MEKEMKDEIIELLENLIHWDTCPQSYKDRIPDMVKALSEPVDEVINKVERCINCGETELMHTFSSRLCKDRFSHFEKR